MKKIYILFLQAGTFLKKFLLHCLQGTTLVYFAELWRNKFCSFLTAVHLEELTEDSINPLSAEHVVWITSLLMFSELLSQEWMFNCSIFYKLGKKKRICKRYKKGVLILSLRKISVYLPSHSPPYCKASKPNLENNDFIIHELNYNFIVQEHQTGFNILQMCWICWVVYSF